MILQKYHAAWAGSGRRALLCVLAYSFLIGTLGAQEVDVPALLAAPDAATSIVPADAPALKNPKMRWAPDDFAKDPTVIRFKGAYYMYFSIPPQEKDGGKYGWTTGIAKSDDLVNWQLVTNLLTEQEVTKKGFCAPCARVYDDKVFLFYQSYGNGPKDAICMSVSEDGINFKPHPKNPIFRPHGDGTNGRAIDADLLRFKDKVFLYAATRDPAGAIQKIVVATADAAPEQLSELEPEDWTQAVDRSILDPELPWETNCIEAPTTIIRGDKLYMFYAGYNNDSGTSGSLSATMASTGSDYGTSPLLPMVRKVNGTNLNRDIRAFSSTTTARPGSSSKATTRMGRTGSSPASRLIGKNRTALRFLSGLKNKLLFQNTRWRFR